MEDSGKTEDSKDAVIEKDGEIVSLSDAVKDEMERLMLENKRLQNLVTEMHQKHHEITMKVIHYFY